MRAPATPIDYASPLSAAQSMALPWPVVGICLGFGVMGVVHIVAELTYLGTGGILSRTSLQVAGFALVLPMLADVRIALDAIGLLYRVASAWNLGGAVGLIALALRSDSFFRRGILARRVMAGLICAWSVAALADTFFWFTRTHINQFFQ